MLESLAIKVGHALTARTQLLHKDTAQLQSRASQHRETRSVPNGLVQDLTGRDLQLRDCPEGSDEIDQVRYFSRCGRVRGDPSSKAPLPLQDSQSYTWPQYLPDACVILVPHPIEGGARGCGLWEGWAFAQVRPRRGRQDPKASPPAECSS